ncbi:MAG: flagellin [Comamonas sp.]
MALTINTNLQSLNSQRALTGSQSSLSTSMARLSSGLRVNSAKDDAAGLAIAERMNAQVKGMNVAIRNANDGISYAQTAEGALGKVGENLQRMRELAVQAANGTNGTVDVGSMGKEYAELKAENQRLIDGTKFNGIAVFNGGAAVTFQIGAGTAAAVDQISVAALTITNTLSTGTLTTNSSGTTEMAALDVALDAVNSARATLGATQNRFEAVVSNLQVASENQSAARSRIMDADFAAETANLSRAQILQQAGTAMLAQANQLPQNVLSLLR